MKYLWIIAMVGALVIGGLKWMWLGTLDDAKRVVKSMDERYLNQSVHHCPNEAQVERLIIENQKLRSENQRNIKTFEALYIEKGNRFEKHIYESEKNILPDVRGMK